MPNQACRIEHDSLGEMEIPNVAYYGVHTQRAKENFPITGVSISRYRTLVIALAEVKKATAKANNELGILNDERCGAICSACDEIINGEYHDQFIVDLIQGGAGTSSNMNANEVIANIALEILGFEKGDYDQIHPNDHVNMSQSTNDVYPTAARLSMLHLNAGLIDAQQKLRDAFAHKGQKFASIVKVARTQLQDAVPMSLGDEFTSFAETIDEDIDRLTEMSKLLSFTNLGGTAVGTGINAPPGYSKIVVRHLSEISQIELTRATNLIEASSDMGAFVTYSGILKRIAVKLSKICNDLRLLSSGPRAGIGEISLPPVQAGSSIMPGKVNPVMPEVVNQIAYQVIGNDLTVTMAAEAGQLQLNAMEPIIVCNILESIETLTKGMQVLTEKCINGIEANTEHCASLLRNSLVLATALVPVIGYAKASRIAKQSLKTNVPLADIVIEEKLLSTDELEALFSVENLVKSTQ